MFLSDEELHELTKRTRRGAQARALRAMGIEHRVRGDGSVVVLRAHVEQVFGVALPKSTKPKPSAEPDWSAI